MPDPVTIALAFAVEERDIERLRRVSPRVRVLPIAHLVRQEHVLLSEGKESGEEYRRVKEELDAALAQAEVLLLFREPKDLVQRIPNVRWVQLTGVGVDNLAERSISKLPIIITDASGNTSRQMAESVIAAMLYFVKRLPELREQQRRHAWERRHMILSGLAEKTVGIVGLGHIGQEVAHLARAFDMRVLATRRSAQERQEGVQGVDVLYPPRELEEMLAESDFVALTLPLTPETQDIINRERLGVMKPTAYLINVSRGRHVDEEALIVALKEGRLAGAALDVTRQEPLPPESELWDMPNVLITPHVTGNVDTFARGCVEVMARNLEMYLAGQPMENRIDAGKGY